MKYIAVNKTDVGPIILMLGNKLLEQVNKFKSWKLDYKITRSQQRN